MLNPTSLKHGRDIGHDDQVTPVCFAIGAKVKGIETLIIILIYINRMHELTILTLSRDICQELMTPFGFVVSAKRSRSHLLEHDFVLVSGYVGHQGIICFTNIICDIFVFKSVMVMFLYLKAKRLCIKLRLPRRP